MTLVPVLMMLFIRGRIMPEAEEPGEPFPDLGLPSNHPPGDASEETTRCSSIMAMAATFFPARQIGSEFMPTLNEGTFLYMPRRCPACR